MYLAITVGAAAGIFIVLKWFFKVAAWKAGIITLGIVAAAWVLFGLGLLLLFMAGMRNLH